MSDDAEIQRLKLEIAALNERIVEVGGARPPSRARGVLAGVVLALAVVATTLALLSIWTFRTVTDTELFVERIGPVIEQPEVAAAVGDAAAQRLVTALNLEERLQETLPENLALLAGPITRSAQEFLSKGVTALVETPAFEQVWYSALATSHQITIGILSGQDTQAVQNDDGVIVLNVAPIINALISESADFLSQLLGKDIEAPTLTGADLQAAVDAVNERLGTEFTGDFATVTIYSSEDLAAAQQWYSVISTAVWLAPLAAAVLIVLALALSRRRLHAALILVAGTAFGLLAVSLLLEPLQSAALGAVDDAGLRAAVAASFDTVVSSLLTRVAFIAGLGVIAAAALLVMRRTEHEPTGGLTGSAGWAARHWAALLIGGAVASVALLALVPGSSGGQVLAIGICYAGFAIAVLLARQGASASRM